MEKEWRVRLPSSRGAQGGDDGPEAILSEQLPPARRDKSGSLCEAQKKKWTRESEIGHPDGQQVHEEGLSIRETQIETTRSYHLKMMAIICQDGHHQKDEPSQVSARVWRERNPLVRSVGMEIGAAMMENDTEVPQKHENRNYHRIRQFPLGGYIQRK